MSIIDLVGAARSHAPTADSHANRTVIHRTRGRGHGEVFRLMSPSDLGRRLKPFVFLDSFGGVMNEFAAAGGMHPHSGIGTVTVFTRGDVQFDDPDVGRGHIGYGGVEWMRAGGGVWHGQELSSGRSERIHGFQLWLALPCRSRTFRRAQPVRPSQAPIEGLAERVERWLVRCAFRLIACDNLPRCCSACACASVTD